jgi:hypothetical protein
VREIQGVCASRSEHRFSRIGLLPAPAGVPSLP